jgi:hypothetical protein
METPKERAQRRHEAQEVIHSLELREAYRMTFDTPHGRTVLRDMILSGHFFETTCTGNAWSHFYEGDRNRILRTMSFIPGIVGPVLAEIMADRQGELNLAAAKAVSVD